MTEFMKGDSLSPRESRFAFKRPSLGGVTSQKKAKPDLMMYYDAGETSAPINCWAENIAAVVPNFGKSKVESPGHGYRGTCVLIHSPMIVDGVETSDTESKFSLEALRDVIYFQCSLYPRIQRWFYILIYVLIASCKFSCSYF